MEAILRCDILRLPEKTEVFFVGGMKRVERALQGSREDWKAQAFGGIHADDQMCLAFSEQAADRAEFIYRIKRLVHCVSPSLMVPRRRGAYFGGEAKCRPQLQ
jgi:hypothetical protein